MIGLIGELWDPEVLLTGRLLSFVDGGIEVEGVVSRNVALAADAPKLRAIPKVEQKAATAPDEPARNRTRSR